MKRDLTEGSIVKTMVITAVPMILALLLQTGFNVVDAIYVGHISAEAIAAVSLAFPIMFFVFAVAGGIGVGATSSIAQFIGAKKLEKADNVAEHALLAGFCLGIFLSIFGLIFGRSILGLMGTKQLVELSFEYLSIIFIGVPFMILFVIGNSIFRGEGDTKTPMGFMIVATIINIILDPIFIFSFGLGVRGAAIATLISNIVGTSLVFFGFARGKSFVKIKLSHFRFDSKILKMIFRIGFPSSLSQISMSVSLFVMMKIVGYFGMYAIAAFGIIFRLDSIAILPSIGLMMAVVPIVGQNIGARKFDRVEKTTYIGASIAATFTAIVGICFFLFPKFFISLFNSQPEVLKYSMMYLRTVTLTYAFIGVSIIIGGSFLGLGNSLSTLLLTLFRVIILVIPIALLLAFIFKLKLLGVWLAYAISNVLAALFSLFLFKTGKWKKSHIKRRDIPRAIP